MGVALVVALTVPVVISFNRMIDREVRAWSAKEGTHVDDLIRDIGIPADDHRVTQGDKLDLCSEDARNLRTIAYEFPDRGLFKAVVWDLTGGGPSSGVVVCLDGSNRVTQTHYYQN